MKKSLFALSFLFFSFCSFSQITTSTKNKFEKEISVSYVVVYPGDFLPSLELSIRKNISPAFHVGLGLSGLYFRYEKKLYVPVFADAEIYFGKKKKFGFNIQAGYGFYNYTTVDKYAWGPGNVIVKRKGNYYLSAGPKYSFNINNKKFNCSVNLVNPTTRHKIYIENTKITTYSYAKNSGINVKVGFVF